MDDLLDQLTPSEPKEDEELEDIELVDTTPKVKTKIDMMMETASRLAQARMNRVLAEKDLKKQYHAKVDSSVSNTNFFSGGIAKDNTNEEDEF